MKYKTLFLILWALLLSCKAKEVYIEKYAYSRTGLILRDVPSQAGKNLAVIPFGTKLQFAQSKLIGEETTIDGLKGIFVPCNYANQQGFVFSGYATILPPPQKSFSDWPQYFTEIYGKPIKSIDKPRPNDSETKNLLVEFANGASIHQITYLDGGHTTLKFPKDISPNDVLLLIRATDPYGKSVTFTKQKNQKLYAKILPFPEHGPTGPSIEYTVEQTGSGLTVTHAWGL